MVSFCVVWFWFLKSYTLTSRRLVLVHSTIHSHLEVLVQKEISQSQTLSAADGRGSESIVALKDSAAYSSSLQLGDHGGAVSEMQMLPSGTMSEMLPSGTMSEMLPSGTVSEMLPSGTMSEMLPSGTVSEMLLPGTMSEMLPSGTVSEMLPGGTEVLSELSHQTQSLDRQQRTQSLDRLERSEKNFRNRQATSSSLEHDFQTTRQQQSQQSNSSLEDRVGFCSTQQKSPVLPVVPGDSCCVEQESPCPPVTRPREEDHSLQQTRGPLVPQEVPTGAEEHLCEENPPLSFPTRSHSKNTSSSASAAAQDLSSHVYLSRGDGAGDGAKEVRKSEDFFSNRCQQIFESSSSRNIQSLLEQDICADFSVEFGRSVEFSQEVGSWGAAGFGGEFSETRGRGQGSSKQSRPLTSPHDQGTLSTASLANHAQVMLISAVGGDPRSASRELGGKKGPSGPPDQTSSKIRRPGGGGAKPRTAPGLNTASSGFSAPADHGAAGDVEQDLNRAMTVSKLRKPVQRQIARRGPAQQVPSLRLDTMDLRSSEDEDDLNAAAKFFAGAFPPPGWKKLPPAPSRGSDGLSRLDEDPFPPERSVAGERVISRKETSSMEVEQQNLLQESSVQDVRGPHDGGGEDDSTPDDEEGAGFVPRGQDTGISMSSYFYGAGGDDGTNSSSCNYTGGDVAEKGPARGKGLVAEKGPARGKGDHRRVGRSEFGGNAAEEGEALSPRNYQADCFPPVEIGRSPLAESVEVRVL